MSSIVPPGTEEVAMWKKKKKRQARGCPPKGCSRVETSDLKDFIFNGVYMYAFVFVHTHVGACEGQEDVSDPTELELPVVVNCPTWALGTKVRASARAVGTLNC